MSDMEVGDPIAPPGSSWIPIRELLAKGSITPNYNPAGFMNNCFFVTTACLLGTDAETLCDKVGIRPEPDSEGIRLEVAIAALERTGLKYRCVCWADTKAARPLGFHGWPRRVGVLYFRPHPITGRPSGHVVVLHGPTTPFARYIDYQGGYGVDVSKEVEACGIVGMFSINGGQSITPQVNLGDWFKDPMVNVNVVISTSDGERPPVSVGDLQIVVSMIPQEGRVYTVEAATWAQAAGGGLVLVGSNPFGFFHTWLTAADFQAVYHHQGKDVIDLPWPTSAAELDAVKNLMNKQDPKASVHAPTIDEVSWDSMSTDLRSRRNAVDSSPLVMGIAADQAAAQFPNLPASEAGQPGRYEWIHRCSRALMGPRSRQSMANTIFGTRECRAHMLRLEHAIAGLVTREQGSLGKLETENVRPAGHVVNRLRSDGVWAPSPVPGWMSLRQDDGWFCVHLRLTWTMRSMPGFFPLNTSSNFDPWSRYSPLLVEVLLDDFVLQKCIEHYNGFISQYTSASIRRPMLLRVANEQLVPRNAIHEESKVALAAAWAKKGVTTILRIPIEKPVVEYYHGRSKGASGITIKSSTLSPGLPSTPPPSTVPDPQGGFVITGTIKLFGNPKVSATLRMWQGPLPDGVVLDDPETVPSIQQATMDQPSLRLPSMVPELAGSAFDVMEFKNVVFLYQNCAFDPTKALGWHLNADWVIGDSSQDLRDVLSKVLGVDQPTLQIHAGLGPDQEWRLPLKAQSVTMDGCFAGLKLEPIPGVVTITTVGARLFGIRAMKRQPELKPPARTAMEYGFAVFGTMFLTVPATPLPLELDCEVVCQNGGMVEIRSYLKTPWLDPLGIAGLTISDASFSTSFAVSAPWKSAKFDVAACFEHGTTLLDLQGSYQPSDSSFSISATLDKFDLRTFLADMFNAMHADTFTAPQGLDIKAESATIAIVSGQGLAITLKNVEVEGHVAISASLTIGKDGITITGELGKEVKFGDEVALKRAYMKLVFPSSKSSKTLKAITTGKQEEEEDTPDDPPVKGAGPEAIIGGEIEFSHGLIFDAAVHLYRVASSDSNNASNKSGGDKKTGSLEWTAMAALTVKDHTWGLSKIVPEVKGTPLDVSLAHVMFVAASRDDPELGNMMGSGYTFHQGVQFCATLTCGIAALDSLTRSSQDEGGLILSAGWSNATGFAVELKTPASTCIALGKGIKTTPIDLRIQTKPDVRLIISAGLHVPVAGQDTPLVFTLSIDAGEIDAKATGEMAGWWVNPCGIGKNVKLGPNVAVDLEIIYAEFFAAGIPSGFGIRGGIMIGKVEASCAMMISEDPMHELISAKVKSLGLRDLVTFLGDITGDHNIPQPPEKLLTFENVDLYICPAGVTFGTIVYPRGCSFNAQMVLFEKRADMACSIGDDGMVIKGGVDNFVLGPLTVRGTAGPRAAIDCDVGKTKQHILIDGVVSFWSADIAVHIEVSALPKPAFMFHLKLSFGDYLSFLLHAELVGTMSYKGLGDADFMFDTDFEQRVLEFIKTQFIKQLQQAKKQADQGISNAKAALDHEKQVMNGVVDDAERKADAARRVWDAKYNEMVGAANKIVAAYLAEVGRLETQVSYARTDYNNAMNAAERDVEKANHDREVAMAAAERDVEYARQDAIKAIAAAQRTIGYAQQVLNNAFSSAEREVEHARSAVQSLQKEIDSLYRTMHDYEHPSIWELWKLALVPEIYASILALEATKATADLALRGAEGFLKSANYIEKVTALNAAHAGLDAAKVVADEAIRAAEAALKVADKTSQLVIDDAIKAMDLARKGVYYIVLQDAIRALETYKRENEQFYRNAMRTIDNVEKCTEFALYKAAIASLEAAKETAKAGISVAQDFLDAAHAVSDFAIDVAQKIISGTMGGLDVQRVNVGGSLRGIVEPGSGRGRNPLSARADIIILGQRHTYNVEFWPRAPINMVVDIFTQFWKGLHPPPPPPPPPPKTFEERYGGAHNTNSASDQMWRLINGEEEAWDREHSTGDAFNLHPNDATISNPWTCQPPNSPFEKFKARHSSGPLSRF